MSAICSLLLLSALLALAMGAITERAPEALQARSPGFWSLVSRDATFEKLASGLRFTEGPVWRRDHLVFSDIPANRIYRWSKSGRLAVYRDPSGSSNGLTLDRQGRLIACEHGNRRVSRTERNGRVVALASTYQGKRLNSPNDVVVRSDGSLYFTDPPYGIRPDEKEQSVNGVYRLTEDGKLSLLIGDFAMPNGLAFSPDERKLYIADSSERSHLRVFEVKADGSLGGGKLFATLKTGEEGVPDGLKVDSRGNVFCTGPAGVWVFSPEGEHLGTLRTPEVPANCAWGDDGHSLYITARTSLYRVRLRTRGPLP